MMRNKVAGMFRKGLAAAALLATVGMAGSVEASAEPTDMISTNVWGFVGHYYLDYASIQSRDTNGQYTGGFFGHDTRRGYRHDYSPSLSTDENGRIFGSVWVSYYQPSESNEVKTPSSLGYKMIPVNGRITGRDTSSANYGPNGEVVRSQYRWTRNAGYGGVAPRGTSSQPAKNGEAPQPATFRAVMSSFGGAIDGRPLNPRQDPNSSTFKASTVSGLVGQTLATGNSTVEVITDNYGGFSITPAAVRRTRINGHQAIITDAFWESPWGERGGGRGATVFTPQRRVLVQGAPYDNPGQLFQTMRNRNSAGVSVDHLYATAQDIESTLANFGGTHNLDTVPRQFSFSTPQMSELSSDLRHPRSLLRPVQTQQPE